MIVECSMLFHNPEYDNLVEDAERMGFKIEKDNGIPEFLPARIAFDPVCIDAHHESPTRKGYSVLHMLDTTFVVKMTYEQILNLRRQASEQQLVTYVQ